jgi:hypothetical protein
VPSPTATPEDCLFLEIEDNDSPEQADQHPALCENIIIEGTMSDRPGDDDRDDYFWIEPEQSGRVQIDLWNIDSPTADFDLYVYQLVGDQYEELDYSITETDRETIRLRIIGAEKYYVRVWRADGSSERPYKLQWSTIQ